AQGPLARAAPDQGVRHVRRHALRPERRAARGEGGRDQGHRQLRRGRDRRPGGDGGAEQGRRHLRRLRRPRQREPRPLGAGTRGEGPRPVRRGERQASPLTYSKEWSAKLYSSMRMPSAPASANPSPCTSRLLTIAPLRLATPPIPSSTQSEKYAPSSCAWGRPHRCRRCRNKVLLVVALHFALQNQPGRTSAGSKSSDRFDEARRLQSVEHVINGLRRVGPRVRDLLHTSPNNPSVQVDLVQHEVVGRLHLDIPWSQVVSREVLEIRCNDHPAPTLIAAASTCRSSASGSFNPAISGSYPSTRQSRTAEFIRQRSLPSFSAGMSGRLAARLRCISSRILLVHL